MKLNELLNIKYPIIQGGMANIATGAFAASVSNAGGLGLIGAGGMNAKMLKAEIQACKKLTNQPFCQNPKHDKAPLQANQCLERARLNF